MKEKDRRCIPLNFVVTLLHDVILILHCIFFAHFTKRPQSALEILLMPKNPPMRKANYHYLEFAYGEKTLIKEKLADLPNLYDPGHERQVKTPGSTHNLLNCSIPSPDQINILITQYEFLKATEQGKHHSLYPWPAAFDIVERTQVRLNWNH